ncbi:MAG: helix-turn-helix transcriptional regulator [Chloroflexota bacterium]
MDVQDQIPLRESTFFIVLSLAPGPKHGYAILKEVEALSDGRLLLSTGTLYGALKRLLDNAWIERVPHPEPDESNRERKAYRLTELGQRILEAETARLRHLVGVAEMQTGARQDENVAAVHFRTYLTLSMGSAPERILSSGGMRK